MNGKRSWKKTDEAEIDLMDLLHQLCMQWKKIALCAFVVMILAGVAGYFKIQRSVKEARAVTMEEADLTPEEKQAVEDALYLAKEVGGLEEYLEYSILMQMDPLEKNRVVSLYSIEDAPVRSVMKIAESYLNYINNGGAAQDLKKTDSKTYGMDSRYLSEVITAWQKTDGTYKMLIGQGSEFGEESDEMVLYVETSGTDKTMARRLADGIHKVLKEYSGDVSRVCGKHALILLGSEEGAVIDSGLFTQQHDKRELLKTYRGNLKTMQESLNTVQKAAFAEMGGKQTDTGEETESESKPSGFSVKYLLLGCFAGIFIYCLVFVLRYLLSDTVKSTAEFCSCYQLPFYGVVSVKQASKNRNTGEPERILSRIRLACKKYDIQKICLAAAFVPAQPERLCMEQIAKQLQEQGIEAVLVENAGKNTDAWDVAAEVGNVLLLCETGVTTHQLIDQEMEFYQENGVTVLGAAILEGI